MKKLKFLLLAVALMFGAAANAQSLSDILKGIGGAAGGSGSGSTISNILEGVFTRTDLSLADLVGEYEATGPAVAFQSDNFLQKAGGIAGAAAIESKLQPYYQQYGLIGMPLVIDSDSNFTMTVKGIKLSGTVTQKEEKGMFTFNIMIGNAFKIGQFTAYIQKSGKNLDLMFDATKMKEFISMVAKYTGSKLATTVGSLLDSYEGMCVGFKMTCTAGGSVFGGSSTTTTNSTDTTATPQSGLGSIFEILRQRSK